MENPPTKVESRAITPAGEVAYATEAAKVLMDVVKKTKTSRKFGGEKEHLYYEAWSTVCAFYHCAIKGLDSVPIGEADEHGRFYGYKATAVVIDINTGKEVGGATAYCIRDESSWRNKSNFALASMAQTRAGSKAARMKFSWVVTLAGYNPTPVEEMEENGYQEPERPSHPKGYKAYLDAMASLKKDVGDTIYYGVLEPYGFKHANEIKDRETQKKIFKELDKIAAGMAKEEEEQLPLTPGET